MEFVGVKSSSLNVQQTTLKWKDYLNLEIYGTQLTQTRRFVSLVNEGESLETRDYFHVSFCLVHLLCSPYDLISFHIF